ncbi:hypothetical protein DM02DRAFT_716160 [Periconia macrospinosa]|uniref:Methyltransferase domain-containing protein n=1 Tax=Periconia macrospinosa TaxID=97972 RepID=A0A2V1E2C3_9PLEO|nr:hypothetical protein DM02DRAFT_716160 [Periconia macrospinosa]
MTEAKPSGWIENPSTITPEATELFEVYAKIPADRVKEHIKKIRDDAFKIHPYPCLATFTFLDLLITESRRYGEVLERVKNGDKFLDLGCCVGQDVRKLVFDGAPSENTYGADLAQGFLDIGYRLFLDESTLKTKFLAADIFDPESSLKQLDGQLDIVYASMFLHLFDYDHCVKAAHRIIKLFKDKPDCLFMGGNLGQLEAGHIPGSKVGAERYRHNAESFTQMWAKVGEDTGTKWQVDAYLKDEDLYAKAEKFGVKLSFIPPGTRWLHFSVRRIA